MQSRNGAESGIPVPRYKYRVGVARKFCEALASSEKSVTKILAENPDFPSTTTLYRWRDTRPAFARLWLRAREAQAEHLMQLCLDLAKSADPKNAHAIRVKFDIYKFFGQKILPAIYGDKPSTTSVSVSTAVVISPERLDAIRAKLDASRALYGERLEKIDKQENLPQSLKDFDHDRKQKSVLKAEDKLRALTDTQEQPEPPE